MKAITVLYRGPTNTKGSRLIASDGDGNRVTVRYNSHVDGESASREAAVELCRKKGWTGTLIGGALMKSRRQIGRVYVWQDRTDVVSIDAAGRAT